MVRSTKTIDVRKLYNSGRRDFSHQQLRRINLNGIQLKEINLEKADLTYADLRNTDLSGANLKYCYLNEANLSGSNLSNADLTGAYLIKAYLTKTNFHKAILKEAYLTGSFLTRANLAGVDITGTFFNNSYLSGATFFDAYYDRATRFDQGILPERLGMKKVSSFISTATKKITIAQVIISFEKVIAVVTHYLGNVITRRHFEQSRPNIEWLNNFTIDKESKICFQGSVNSKATSSQLKWLEKWTHAFIDLSSTIIHDLPMIIEDKTPIM